MKNKKKVLAGIGVIALVLGAVVFLLNGDSRYATNATPDEMLKINNFMSQNYLGYVSDFYSNEIPGYEGTIYSVLYKNPDPQTILTDEEKFTLGIDLGNTVYRMSKEELNKGVLEKFGIDMIEYNFLDTRVTGDIFIVSDDEVFYTMPKDEYIYFIKDIQKKENTIVILWEYKKTSDTTAYLDECMNNGEIPRDVEPVAKYIVTFEEKDGQLEMVSKQTTEFLEDNEA